MSFNAALTIGSGFGAAAILRGGGAAERLKFGREKRSKFGNDKERWSKFGKEKLGQETLAEFGRELAVAAPMMASAARDTSVAVTRVEAPCGTASGCPSSSTSLSGVSATCVSNIISPVAGFFLRC